MIVQFWIITIVCIVMIGLLISFNNEPSISIWEKIFNEVFIVIFSVLMILNYVYFKLDMNYIKMHNGVLKKQDGYIAKVDTVKGYPLMNGRVIEYYIKNNDKEINNASK